MRLIDADTLLERTCNLEAQALDYVGKLIERDGDKVSTEWKVWSAILTERTAFKHDVLDAQTIERKKGKWIKIGNTLKCPICGAKGEDIKDDYCFNFCPNCGAYMREDDET